MTVAPEGHRMTEAARQLRPWAACRSVDRTTLALTLTLFYRVANWLKTLGLTGKMVIVWTVTVLVGLVRLWLIVETLRAAWRFTMTQSHLIAVHRLARQRIEFLWTTIRGVTTVPLPRWHRDAGAGWNRITLADGREPRFSPLMLRHGQFLDELKARAVNCNHVRPVQLR